MPIIGSKGGGGSSIRIWSGSAGSGNIGGPGATSNITGSPDIYAGGGSGGNFGNITIRPGSPGGGGGAPAVPGSNGFGGGGGGSGGPSLPTGNGGSGGSGKVIIRGPSNTTWTVSPPSNTTDDHPGGDKLATFNVTGTLDLTGY
jgi:hypothetical protein